MIVRQKRQQSSHVEDNLLLSCHVGSGVIIGGHSSENPGATPDVPVTNIDDSLVSRVDSTF